MIYRSKTLASLLWVVKVAKENIFLLFISPSSSFFFPLYFCFIFFAQHVRRLYVEHSCSYTTGWPAVDGSIPSSWIICLFLSSTYVNCLIFFLLLLLRFYYYFGRTGDVACENGTETGSRELSREKKGGKNGRAFINHFEKSEAMAVAGIVATLRYYLFVFLSRRSRRRNKKSTTFYLILFLELFESIVLCLSRDGRRKEADTNNTHTHTHAPSICNIHLTTCLDKHADQLFCPGVDRSFSFSSSFILPQTVVQSSSYGNNAIGRGEGKIYLAGAIGFGVRDEVGCNTETLRG